MYIIYEWSLESLLLVVVYSYLAIGEERDKVFIQFFEVFGLVVYIFIFNNLVKFIN